MNRFFLKRGISQEYIHILLDANATRKNIVSTIRQTIFNQVTEDEIQLFIFFSGHGIIVEEKGVPPESVLITHDTNYSDILSTGILISELVKIIKRLFVKELYIFLDACFMSINSVARTFSEIPDLDLFKRLDSSNCFLCMVANHEAVTIEPINGGLGFFTNTIIESIEIVEKEDNPSISKLVESIQNNYALQNVGNPYVVFAGAINNWPFSKQVETSKVLKFHENEEALISREDIIKELIFFLRRNSPKPIFITGESGIGKTTLLYELSQDIYDAIFIHITKKDSLENILEFILLNVVQNEILSNFHFESFINVKDNFKKIIQYFPQLILCIDGIEHLSDEIFLEVFDFFKKINIQICATLINKKILSSNMLIFECPPFSYEETKKLANNFKIYEISTIEMIYNKSKGFPLKVKSLVMNPDIDINDKEKIFFQYMDTIQKLIASNGYIDRYEFSKKMNINILELESLEKLGYIIKIDKIWFAHDELLRYFNNDDISDKFYLQAMKYWCHEKKSWRRYLTPNIRILDLFTRKYKLFYSYDSCISDSLERIYTTQESPLDINKIFNIVKNNDSNYIIIFSKLMEFFSDLGDISKISEIEQFINSFENIIDNEKYILSLKLSFARLSWWIGNYNNCIHLGQNVIKHKNSSNQLMCKANLEVAIGYFFLGEWDNSKSLLQNVLDSEYSTAKTFAWAKLIMGTIDSIRGINFQEAKEYLDSSIRILYEENDLYGLAIAYGNLGEALWKAKRYEESNKYLDNCIKYAKIIDLEINLIEGKRNKLQLNIRWKNPFSKVVSELIKELTLLSTDKIGKMEMMQVSNTLATAYIYQKNISKATEYIKIAYGLTKKNREYHIYTLGNQCLLNILEGVDFNTIKLLFQELKKLVDEGNNLFALEQIKDDLNYLYNNYGYTLAKELVNGGKE